MSATAHLYEIFVRAPRERVWQALTDPDDTVRYFHGTRFESSFEAGAPYRNVIVDGDRLAVDGVIEAFDPPRRLVLTWHVNYDEGMAAEPPGRVEWTLTPANQDGSVTRVTLRHGDLALSPATWEHVRLGWVEILDGLKTLLETGEPLPPVDTGGSDIDAADVEGNWHRAQAITANNSVWELLDGRELGGGEVDDLLQRAYAAAYHWRRATGATTVNQARASWLVSRAHATAGQGAAALHHADRTSALVAEAADEVADFDHAYAYEARARALACLGRVDEAGEAYRRAATVTIADEQDRSIFTSDLAAEPWFGLER
ncbi:MAG: SRPBCC family protein [Ilumatobacter sp.]|uniref:SRPBCC family protein n=1 Tax=Ilumatobacter sp. TaxID=1967498 RepID=UPI002619F68B|nr:SRPBCC family protein [Ilumatobacter sp.]MDJ0769184.1 SRPBCC family protein [Ilumatobacter sp.]